MTIALMAFVCVGFAACGGDDDDDNGGMPGGGVSGDIPMELLGTWNCDAGKRYLSFTFNADGTGTGTVTYEGDTRESNREYTFAYTVSNGTVTCTGIEIYYDTDGKVTENKNWTTTFTFTGNVLKGGPFSGDSTSNTFYYGGGGQVTGDEIPRQLIGTWHYQGPDAEGGDGFVRTIEWVFNYDGTGTGNNDLKQYVGSNLYSMGKVYYSFTYAYSKGKLLLDAESWYGSETHQHLRMDHLVFEDGKLKDTQYGYVFTRDGGDVSGETSGDIPAPTGTIVGQWVGTSTLTSSRKDEEGLSMVLHEFAADGRYTMTHYAVYGHNLKQETNRIINDAYYDESPATLKYTAQNGIVTLTNGQDSYSQPYVVSGTTLTLTEPESGKEVKLTWITWFEKQLIQDILAYLKK